MPGFFCRAHDAPPLSSPPDKPSQVRAHRRPSRAAHGSLSASILSCTIARFAGSELEKYDYDLYAWRESSPKAKVMDLSLLDMNNGAGFDLAAKLVLVLAAAPLAPTSLELLGVVTPWPLQVCKRNKYFRGRLNATQALRHRYFLFG